MEAFCVISVGELVDKLAVLAVKLKNIDDDEKKKAITKEYYALQKTLSKMNILNYDKYLQNLIIVNEIIWNAVNKAWQKEKKNEIDLEFAKITREILIENDNRFKIKEKINLYYSSDIQEIKSY